MCFRHMSTPRFRHILPLLLQQRFKTLIDLLRQLRPARGLYPEHPHKELQLVQLRRGSVPAADPLEQPGQLLHAVRLNGIRPPFHGLRPEGDSIRIVPPMPSIRLPSEMPYTGSSEGFGGIASSVRVTSGIS